ncbi:ABC transporter permease subunit [Priestia taiwanensis]|uniref:ABC-2 family transporter protein n=1 Tax=Priestia taiwanensis TaxID=1347902 RepID=A0A917AYL2_9BACI|nr:ABC transporter permease subunit [Priestia taiwanensis]MBM7365266.1 ABC-2 type transport system permease protein [Priestia taiwanensis]GGE85676.1 hypothetical protein GCM10007140_38820 [Priestia taiwanensis]
MKLFLFECKKLWKKRTTWFTIVISAVAVIGLYISSYSMGEQIRRENIQETKGWVEDYPKHAEEKEVEMKEAEKADNQQLLISLLGNKERDERRYKHYQQLLQSYGEKDWQEFNKVMLEKSSSKEIVEQPDGIVHVVALEGGQEISPFTARSTLEELKWLAKTEVEPFAQIKTMHDEPFLSTIYDDFTGTALEQWEELKKRYATTGLSFVYQLVQFGAIPILILIGCFLFGNNISSEIGKKKRGLLFYYVLPVRRINVFLAKYISGLLSTMLFVVGILVVPIGVSMFIGEIGSLQYPILVYEGSAPSTVDPMFNSLKPLEDGFHFISLKEYIGQVLLLAIVLTVMVYSLYYAFAILFKMSPVTVLMTAIITFSGMKMAPLPYNPFSYVDMNKVINGEAAALAFNPAISIQNGVIFITVFTSILIVLGYALFRRIKI